MTDAHGAHRDRAIPEAIYVQTTFGVALAMITMAMAPTSTLTLDHASLLHLGFNSVLDQFWHRPVPGLVSSSVPEPVSPRLTASASAAVPASARPWLNSRPQFLLFNVRSNPGLVSTSVPGPASTVTPALYRLPLLASALTSASASVLASTLAWLKVRIPFL